MGIFTLGNTANGGVGIVLNLFPLLFKIDLI